MNPIITVIIWCNCDGGMTSCSGVRDLLIDFRREHQLDPTGHPGNPTSFSYPVIVSNYYSAYWLLLLATPLLRQFANLKAKTGSEVVEHRDVADYKKVKGGSSLKQLQELEDTVATPTLRRALSPTYSDFSSFCNVCGRFYLLQ
jgi:hypothetical protein